MLDKFNTISVLKLQNCRVNAFGITIIAKMLVEIGCVKDLNLDMNPNAKENFHLLCTPGGNLLYLSLKLCEISDVGVENISKELEYNDSTNIPKLVALNLTNNRITEAGAIHIARMLRTNRSLQSLDLSGNGLHDEGAVLIIRELSMSTLSHEEIVEKRRRRFAELTLQEEQNRTRESTSRMLDDETINKSRKKSGLSQRSKKSLHRLSSASVKADDPHSARSSCEKAGIIVVDTDRHPFKTENAPLEGSIVICGNFALQHLNLSFCGLTLKSLNILIECLSYQNYMLESDRSRGLLFVPMEGNSIPDDSEDSKKFHELLRQRWGRKPKINLDNLDNLIPTQASLLRDTIRLRIPLISE